MVSPEQKKSSKTQENFLPEKATPKPSVHLLDFTTTPVYKSCSALAQQPTLKANPPIPGWGHERMGRNPPSCQS